MRRTPLILAAVLAIIGVGAVALYLANQPTTLTVAVGPAASDNLRLAQALQQLLMRERSSVRLRVVTTDGSQGSALLLRDQSAQLAVVRSDIDYPAEGLAIATMRRDVLAFMVPSRSAIEDVGGLRGKTVGVVFGAGANQQLLRRVLTHYDMSDPDVTSVRLGHEEAPAALRSGRVDAILAVGPASGLAMTDVVHRLSEAVEGGVRFLPVSLAGAIARRSPALEEAEILRGAFGGNPPRPPESVATVGITYRLVAHRNVDESTIATFTQLLFALRPALTAELPLASQVEAPDTDRGAVVPVHPGAIQYIEGNIRSFFDRFSDWFYLIVMLVGLAGSALAALMGMASNQDRGERLRGLEELVALLASARNAEDKPGLDAVETRVDQLFATTLKRISDGELDGAQIAAFTLAFDQVRHAIADRRIGLPAVAPQPRFAAAE
jgi:TRAP transporter TAXI family solute receptor